MRTLMKFRVLFKAGNKAEVSGALQQALREMPRS